MATLLAITVLLPVVVSFVLVAIPRLDAHTSAVDRDFDHAGDSGI